MTVDDRGRDGRIEVTGRRPAAGPSGPTDSTGQVDSTGRADSAGSADRRDGTPDGDRRRWPAAASGLLGLAFLASGARKLAGADDQVAAFERFGYPQWFRQVTGLLEVAGGTGLVAAVASPMLAVAGGAVTAVVTAGATATHLVRARDPAGEAAPAALLGGASLGVAAVQWRRDGDSDDGGA
jgi:uncharacterized membrane protein YphA (DoxX/SURF4 family)